MMHLWCAAERNFGRRQILKALCFIRLKNTIEVDICCLRAGDASPLRRLLGGDPCCVNVNHELRFGIRLGGQLRGECTLFFSLAC